VHLDADHWHAYMTVEACKAGKDVYVEKPSCRFVEEGRKMVQAARKYNRIVQAGTMQRSGATSKRPRNWWPADPSEMSPSATPSKAER